MGVKISFGLKKIVYAQNSNFPKKIVNMRLLAHVYTYIYIYIFYPYFLTVETQHSCISSYSHGMHSMITRRCNLTPTLICIFQFKKYSHFCLIESIVLLQAALFFFKLIFYFFKAVVWCKTHLPPIQAVNSAQRMFPYPRGIFISMEEQIQKQQNIL